MWLVWLVLVCTSLGGCASELVVRLDHWSIDGRPVVLPTRADVDDRVERFVMRTQVALPRELRGKTLTLAIPQIEAKIDLQVDGVSVPPLDDPGTGFRGDRSPRFRLQTDKPVLDLALVVENDTPQSTFLSTIPRLSATAWGDARFRFTKTFDQVSSAIALGTLLGMLTTYAILWFLDRKKAEYRWITLAVVLGMSSPLLWLGWTEYMFGRMELTVVAEMLGFAAIAVLAFMYAHFGLPPPSRWWAGVVALLIGLTIFGALSKPGARLASMAALVADYAVIARLGYVLYALSKKRPRPPDIVIMTVALGALLLSTIPTALWRFQVIHPLEGLTLTPLGLTIFLLVHGLTLSRAHVNAASTAAMLNDELEKRVHQLESKRREAMVLNIELKRQIADRSSKLADALSRMEGAVSSGPRGMRPGDVIDERYRIVRQIGSGGMGTVLEVERVVDGKHFALKVLHGEANTHALSRFAREAEIAARLDHPNLVSVIDVDVAKSGSLYIVMELVSGVPLENMKDRYCDAEFILDILRQIARGLAALHEHGVIHRDLKPGNVLVDEHGKAKIADFGIASLHQTVDPLAQTEAPSTLREKNNPLTHEGALMGTPLYMAPELWRGAAHADEASDIWSFGLIAYVTLNNHYPWKSPAVFEVSAGRSLPPLPPIECVSRELNHLFQRCLDVDPLERPTAAEVADTLADALSARA